MSKFSMDPRAGVADESAKIKYDVVDALLSAVKAALVGGLLAQI
jgi:hypothetical protein